jgi:hypothetical protein
MLAFALFVFLTLGGYVINRLVEFGAVSWHDESLSIRNRLMFPTKSLEGESVRFYTLAEPSIQWATLRLKLRQRFRESQVGSPRWRYGVCACAATSR